MKKSLFIIFILVISMTRLSYSQYFYIYGDKALGGNSEDGAANMIYTNNQFLLCGQSSSNISGDKSDSLCNPSLLFEKDLWIIKIDTAFNILWQQNIGGNNYDIHPHIHLMNENSKILFSCHSRSDSSCSKSENNRSFPLTFDDYWIGVLDSNGTKMWDKTLGGSSAEESSKSIELSTGELIVCGATTSPADGDKSVTNYGGYDYWILKLDSLGNKIWDKVFGGNDNEISANQEYDVIPLSNGEFLFGGRTQSQNTGTITEISRGLFDIWIAKIDNAGNQIWDKRYGGNSGEALWQIKPTLDGGYIFCGTTNSNQSGEVSDTSRGMYDIWVVKIDSIGNKMWDKRFGSILSDEAKSIEQDYDGGYIIGGNVRGGAGLDVTEPAYGSTDYWVVKIDSIGNKVWDKRFGGPGANYLTSLVLLPDSSIVLFGSADSGITSIKTDPGEGWGDYWLVRFKYSNSPFALNEVSNDALVSIYPNPTTGLISVTSKGNYGNMEFLLYDVTGRIIFSDNITSSSTIDISEFSPSFYFYEVIFDKGKKSFGKILKQ